MLRKINFKISEFLFFLICFTNTSLALAPEARLADETMEQRARDLFLTVRCLVCGGQVIDSSNTEFSFEMRKLIRKKILEGKSDHDIKEELVQEFGPDILIDPIKYHGLALYYLPLLFAICVIIIYKKSFKDSL